MASVYDFTLFGTLLPVIAEDFGWSVAESTAINTYATIGVFLGYLIAGQDIALVASVVFIRLRERREA